MGMGKGYVFSLDAFVAFSLILISVQILLVMSSAPAAHYYPLLQAEYLARDTLEVMAVAKPPCGATCPRETYMELIAPYAVTNTCNSNPACMNWLKELCENSIPSQYSYAFFYEDLGGASYLLYNASSDHSSKHYDLQYQRVMASSHTLLQGYSLPLKRGDSPYCNVVCRGYDPTLGGGAGGYKTAAACANVPCLDVPASNFDPGQYKVGLLRMVVWG